MSMVTWHSSAAARRARTAAAPPTCIGVRHDTPSAALTSAPCWISRRISSTSPRRAATCRTVSPAAIFRCGFSFNRVCSGLCSPSSLPVAATISESNARDLAGSPLAIADASLLTRCCTFGSWWPCLSLLCLSLLCFLLLGMEEPNTRLDQLEHAKASPRAGRVAEVGLTPEKGRVSVQVEAAPVPGPRGVCDDRVNLASTSKSLSLNQASKASCLLCTQELRCVGIYLRTSRSSASRTASCMWHAPASAIPGTSGSHCCPTRGDGQVPHTQRGLQGGAHVLSC